MLITRNKFPNYRQIRLESMDDPTNCSSQTINIDIPYPISNGSILNQTIFIPDIKHNTNTINLEITNDILFFFF